MGQKKLNYSAVFRMLLVTALFIGSLGLLGGQTATAPAIGDGSEDNPYQIATLENLYWIAAEDEVVAEPNQEARWSSHYIQTANIDASDTEEWFDGRGWSPIGNWNYQYDNLPFTGYYDGHNHTIDSLYINRYYSHHTGLFGRTEEATIENLGLTNVDITGNDKVGSLVGYARESSVSNNYSTGNVTGNDYAGGLVGLALDTTINSSYSTGNVTGEIYVGGLVGFGSNVSNSYYNYEQVLINGENVITIGALDDEMYNTWFDNDLSLDIDDYLDFDGNSYLINSVSDFKKLLAFGQFEEHSYQLTANLNLADHPNFYIPYLSGDFDGNELVVDNLTLNMDSFCLVGLFGKTVSANIKNLGVTNVDVTGEWYAGCLVGGAWDSTISKCYSSGNVTGGGRFAGGLAGFARYSTISNSYSTGSVTGSSFVGGFVGLTGDSTISNCYSNSERRQ